MATRRTGIEYEREVKKYLENHGALYVIRSAGSHGPADMIVVDQTPRLIQCKAGKIGRADRDAVRRLSMKLGTMCTCELWYRDKYLHCVDQYYAGVRIDSWSEPRRSR